MNGEKGFTLLEVLVVTVIAASVLVFAIPAYKRAQDKNLYVAAQGILLELRGGMLAMRQDLRLSGNNLSFPLNHPQLMTPTLSDVSAALYISSRDKGMENIEETELAYALFSHNYMQPIPFDDLTNNEYKRYKFYVCPGTTSFAPQCCGTDSVACMVDSDACETRETRGLYATARINEQGEIERVEDSCSGTTWQGNS